MRLKKKNLISFAQKPYFPILFFAFCFIYKSELISRNTSMYRYMHTQSTLLISIIWGGLVFFLSIKEFDDLKSLKINVNIDMWIQYFLWAYLLQALIQVCRHVQLYSISKIYLQKFSVLCSLFLRCHCFWNWETFTTRFPRSLQRLFAILRDVRFTRR